MFDPLLDFHHPNFSKATILRLSEDLGHAWTKFIHEDHPTDHPSIPAFFHVLTTVYTSGYIKPRKPENRLILEQEQGEIAQGGTTGLMMRSKRRTSKRMKSDQPNDLGEVIETESQVKGQLRHGMRRRFVPTHYHCDLHQKLRNFLQGKKFVEDYYQEMEILMIKADVDEPLEATMARFLSGLNRDIQDRMDIHEYATVEQMLHKAILIEQHVKRKSYSKPAITSKPTYAPKPSYQDKGKYSSTTHNSFKTDVPARVEKGKEVETPGRARDIRCFKCQGLGHYAKNCPNQRVMILMENGEVETVDEKKDKEDLGPIFDEEEVSFDYPHHGPLLVARKTLDDPIFDEEDDHLVDCFGPTFDTDSGPIFDDEDSLDYPEFGPLLVTRRSLSVQPKTDDKEQRENLFHSRCLISEKFCSLIIDGSTCVNVASETLVRKLGLVTRPLSRPLRLE
ncbi:hypothetical protein N665_0154s0003 [Sinapis alba]|nr:hypothetical protein N665_0154s0003 [Sinapis alba]